jgi:hypothetical protein
LLSNIPAGQQAYELMASAIAALYCLDRARLTGSPHATTLASARQSDLEEWLASTHRTDAGTFVRWAKKHKLTRLDFAAVRWGGPTGIMPCRVRVWICRSASRLSGICVREFSDDRGVARLRCTPAAEPAPAEIREQHHQVGASQQILAVPGEDARTAAVCAGTEWAGQRGGRQMPAATVHRSSHV